MNILITGGTGSFGKAFTRKVIDQCERLVIFSRDEWKQWEMREEFPESKYPQLRYFIGDVRDQCRLETALYGIDTIIHAAAIKHVTVAEYNPFETIKTNVNGAENVVRAAISQKVKKVIGLSSDKAVAPVNLYGASKLAAEKIFVAANQISRGVKFSVVRYGNVIGSRGSVIPYFRKLIAEGALSLPITDERMTRFWLTLEQGVAFVLSCLEQMKGAEIFVPKCPSMSMVEVAKALLPDCDIRITGIRPGEKLHECLITEDEQGVAEMADRFVIHPSMAGSQMRFSSDKNEKWLSREEFRCLLGLDAHPANGVGLPNLTATEIARLRGEWNEIGQAFRRPPQSLLSGAI